MMTRFFRGAHGMFLVMTRWIITLIPLGLFGFITSTGNAGVPMGCFFLSVSLLSSMNVPITFMGVILPFYALIDMLETALNVCSDACVTKVVNDKALADNRAEERKKSALELELGPWILLRIVT